MLRRAPLVLRANTALKLGLQRQVEIVRSGHTQVAALEMRRAQSAPQENIVRQLGLRRLVEIVGEDLFPAEAPKQQSASLVLLGCSVKKPGWPRVHLVLLARTAWRDARRRAGAGCADPAATLPRAAA